MLLPDYEHPRNREHIGAIYLGRHGAMERYPDLYKGEQGGIVLDAKYKNDVKRDDQNQVISYMYRLQSRHGGFLMPARKIQAHHSTDLLGYGMHLGSHYLAIPDGADSYSNFCQRMASNEDGFIAEINML